MCESRCENDNNKNLGMLSMNQISTPNLDFEESLRAYHKAGYTGAGIWFDKLVAYGVDRAVELLKDIPIKITHAIFIGPFNQKSESDYLSARRQDIERIQIAGKLGIECVLALTGNLNGLSISQGERQIVRGLRDISGAAEDAGIKIGFEPIHSMYSSEWTFVSTLSKALEIINEVDHRSVGIFFDTYHLWQEPGLLETIKRAKGKIVGCHICDWRPITRSASDRVLMGDGCIPFKEILAALKEAGWDKWYDVEIFSDELWSMNAEEFLKEVKDKYTKMWE